MLVTRVGPCSSETTEDWRPGCTLCGEGLGTWCSLIVSGGSVVGATVLNGNFKNAACGF